MRYKKQRVKKGSKMTRLWDWFFMPEVNQDFILKGFLYGSENGIKYDVGAKEQGDWLKWAGVYFDLYQPHGRTVMVAMRYVIELDKYEWTFYYHNIQDSEGYKAVGSVPGYVDEMNTIYTEAGEVPDWYFRFDSDTHVSVELRHKGEVISDTVRFEKPFGKMHTRGNIHWGGTMPAQDDIEGQKSYRRLEETNT